MKCKKCDSPKTVILRKKDYYCDDCFMVSTNHKFRACIGKNKVLSPHENVLIGLSGGLGSTVLLDLVHHGISLENTKKLRIKPFFIHLFDDNYKGLAESIIAQCQKYNFDVYVVHLAAYMSPNCQLPEPNCIPDVEENETRAFHDMLNSMPPSAATDFLLKIKRSLLVQYAKLLKCNVVFTAQTTNTLAINFLSNLAVGRGSQLQNDIGFCDARDEYVKIIKPIKDISIEELKYYVDIRQLAPVYVSDIKNGSMQSVISAFVSDLQENFQATISTVCKTADKIGEPNNEYVAHERCNICESDLQTKDLKLSALEATNLSRTVSFGNTELKQNLEKNADFLNNFDDFNSSMFPLINKYLCYSCSRNYSEMNQSKLPLHIRNKIND
ncbi:hypothetical protein PYW08_008245 [Mythimna loreyi]|uniref:Uncharacterized protein n=1 Tax=Mythimna loreyi TaxID=667449 RepID=A0ACC2QEU1_9NEOP|nr:hypothetical protein PYW08_008245 [Mythimna loreyi]